MGIARLYEQPNTGGSPSWILSSLDLNPSKPWYVRFIAREATSSGFGAGDARLNLYSFSSVVVPEPGAGPVALSACSPGRTSIEGGKQPFML